jgi:hypothetical protein
MLPCKRCGASLEIPLDLAAMTVRCNYCGETTALPNDVLNARRQERMARMAATAPAVQPKVEPKESYMWIVWVLVGTIGLMVAITVLELVSKKASPPPEQQTPIAQPLPAPTPKPIASDAKSTGQVRMTERMKQLYDLGCKNVIMPPEQAQGAMKLDTKFAAKGTCVRILVTTGSADNTMHLTLKTPFGEDIQTPPASREVEFNYCPTQSGPYPAHITPKNEDYFTIAAVECPKSVK